MTLSVFLSAVVLVLLAVSIHLGAMRMMNALMLRWNILNRNWVSILILVVIVAHLLEISLFAIGLGRLVSSGAHGQLMGRINLGSPTIFTTPLLHILRWDSMISHRPAPCGFSLPLK